MVTQKQRMDFDLTYLQLQQEWSKAGWDLELEQNELWLDEAHQKYGAMQPLIDQLTNELCNLLLMDSTSTSDETEHRATEIEFLVSGIARCCALRDLVEVLTH